MYAVFRETRYRPGEAVVVTASFDKFNAAHATQPGYRGNVVADAGDGRLLSVTLWDTAEAMDAARETLGPVVARLLGPMMTAPPVLLGAGPVVVNDLVPA